MSPVKREPTTARTPRETLPEEPQLTPQERKFQLTLLVSTTFAGSVGMFAYGLAIAYYTHSLQNVWLSESLCTFALSIVLYRCWLFL